MSNQLRNLFVVALIASVAACGGGGGSSTPTETTLSGVVSKGPAVGAKVKVYAVVNGVKGNLLTQTTTTTGGKYELKFAQQSGPVLIEADLEDSNITNEATNTTFKGTKGDVMKAAFVPGSSATQTVNVTPFSHMAAAAAESAKDLSANSVLAANAVVRQILDNKDFLTVSPTASSGDSLLPQLTLLATRSVDTNGASQIGTLLTELNQAVEKNTSGEFTSSTKYVQALCGTVTDGCTTGTAAKFADKSVVKPVAPSTNFVAVEAAKALFKDLYDTFTSIKSSGDLQKSADGLTVAAANAVAFIDDDQMQLISAAASGVSLLKSYQQGSSITYTSGYVYGPYPNITWTCSVGIVAGLDSNGHWLDSTLASTTAGDFTNNTANAVFCSGRPYFYGGTIVRSDTGGIYAYPSVYNQLVLVLQTDGQVSYTSRVRVSGAYTGATTGTAAGTNSFTLGGLTAYQYGTAKVNISTDQTSGTATLIGTLAPSARFVVFKGLDAWKGYAYHDINLSVSASGSEVNGVLQSASVALSGAIKLLKYTDDTKTSKTELSSLNIVSGSISTSGLDMNVNVQAPGIKVEGIVTGAVASMKPTALTFTGAIYEGDTANSLRKLLEGKVEGTSLSDTGGTVKFTGQLLLKNRQPMVVTVSGTNANDVWTSKTATFAWNSQSFTLKQVVSGGVVTGLQVANSGGVTFVVPTTGIGTSGVDVFSGADKIGKLFNTGRIEFIDATYLAF